ncbi:MAG: KH domain-containing protein [Oligosphaeraceae bacterium]|nr:KH domain-containing protein [Oligosphaeraceae bacterium]
MSNEQSLESLASEVLSEMVRLLGITAEVSCGELEGKRLKLCLDSGNAGRLIGRKGQSLESLELLLNRILKCANEKNPWVPVEVDGYSTGRTGGAGPRRRGERVDNEKFTCLATDTAKEVKLWRKEKKLGPFSPAERRVIHMTLKDDEEIFTESESIPGESGRKYVIVKLKGA